MENKKLLTICNYLTDDEYPQFTKNRTGYGYVVSDILKSLSTSYSLSIHAYSGNYASFPYRKSRALDNRVLTSLCNGKFRDILRGICYFIKNVKHKKEALRVAYSYLCLGLLKKRIDEHDVVHIHGCTPNLLPFIELSLLCGKKTVVTLHGLNSFSELTKASVLIRTSEKQFLRLLKHYKTLQLTVLTPAAKEQICAFVGKECYDQISVIPNFIDSAFDLVKPKENIGQVKTVLYVGNLSEQKNQKALLRVIKTNWREYENKVKFLFIGEFCGDFGVELEFFGNKPHLVEFTGHIPREKVLDYYSECDLVVLLSKVEGFGMSLIEGFCAGVPCVLNAEMEISSLLPQVNFIHRVNNVNDETEVAACLRTALQTEVDKDEIKSFSLEFNSDVIIEKYKLVLG